MYYYASILISYIHYVSLGLVYPKTDKKTYIYYEGRSKSFASQYVRLKNFSKIYTLNTYEPKAVHMTSL